MVVASFTQIGKEYEVTVLNGEAISCTCGDHKYRHHICKHMINASGQIQMEIEKAATFLALKAQIEKSAPLYSEVCGHLVRRYTDRSCGCMA